MPLHRSALEMVSLRFGRQFRQERSTRGHLCGKGGGSTAACCRIRPRLLSRGRYRRVDQSRESQALVRACESVAVRPEGNDAPALELTCEITGCRTRQRRCQGATRRLEAIQSSRTEPDGSRLSRRNQARPETDSGAGSIGGAARTHRGEQAQGIVVGAECATSAVAGARSAADQRRASSGAVPPAAAATAAPEHRRVLPVEHVPAPEHDPAGRSRRSHGPDAARNAEPEPVRICTATAAAAAPCAPEWTPAAQLPVDRFGTDERSAAATAVSCARFWVAGNPDAAEAGAAAAETGHICRDGSLASGLCFDLS